MGWQGSEAELAAPVVEWLTSWGYEVYQEVTFNGRCADIVAVKDGRLWVLEVKKVFGLGVIEQALFWKHLAHKVSVVAPHTSFPSNHYNENSFYVKLMKWTGIGVVTCSQWGCDEKVPPQILRFQKRKERAILYRRKMVTPSMLARVLRGEHKESKAGHPAPIRHTPFKETVKNIQNFVRGAKEPVTMRQISEKCQHHYHSDSAARSALQGAIERGLVKGVKIIRQGRSVLVVEDDGR